MSIACASRASHYTGRLCGCRHRRARHGPRLSDRSGEESQEREEVVAGVPLAGPVRDLPGRDLKRGEQAERALRLSSWARSPAAGRSSEAVGLGPSRPLPGRHVDRLAGDLP